MGLPGREKTGGEIWEEESRLQKRRGVLQGVSHPATQHVMRVKKGIEKVKNPESKI